MKQTSIKDDLEIDEFILSNHINNLRMLALYGDLPYADTMRTYCTIKALYHLFYICDFDIKEEWEEFLNDFYEKNIKRE